MELIILIAAVGTFFYMTGIKRSVDDRTFDESDLPKSHKTPRKYRQVARKVAPLRPSPRPTQATLLLPPFPESMKIKGKAYVIDGDTIRIGSTKIRLAGIDAPEEDQPWGRKSKWAMYEICKGQVITVELDGTRSYDRLVGTCYLPDGRDIGAEIVKCGLALDLPEFSHGKYRRFEPQGARRRLANGAFGHKSLHHRNRKT